MVDWIALAIAVISLILTTWRWYLDKKQSRRDRYQRVLREFLKPLQSRLAQTERIYLELQTHPVLRPLEFPAPMLKAQFEALPDDDVRKLIWKDRISRLMAIDDEALDLIKDYGGYIISDEFKDACLAFEYHVGRWQDLWKAVEGSAPWPTGRQDPLVEKFPPAFVPALKAEKEEIERLAGVDKRGKGSVL